MFSSGILRQCLPHLGKSTKLKLLTRLWPLEQWIPSPNHQHPRIPAKPTWICISIFKMWNITCTEVGKRFHMPTVSARNSYNSHFLLEKIRSFLTFTISKFQNLKPSKVSLNICFLAHLDPWATFFPGCNPVGNRQGTIGPARQGAGLRWHREILMQQPDPNRGQRRWGSSLLRCDLFTFKASKKHFLDFRR